MKTKTKKKIQFCNYSVNTVFQFGSKLYSSLKFSLVVEVWNLCSHPFPFSWGHRKNKFHQFQGDINCGWEIKNTFNLSPCLTFVSQNYFLKIYLSVFGLIYFWLNFFVSRKCKFACLSAGSVPFSISVCVFFFAVPAEYVVSLTNGFSQNSCLRWSKTPAMQMRLSYQNKLDTTWTAECIPPPKKKKFFY